MAAQSPRTLLAAAIERHREGDLAEAARGYRRVLRVVPEHADALHLLGVIELQEGRLASAELLFERALRQRGDFADALTHLGTVREAQGRIEDAVALYRRAIEREPAHPDANYKLGRALLRIGRAHEAAAVLESAVRINEGHADTWLALGNAELALDRPLKAAAAHLKAARLAPNSAAVFHNLGISLHILRRFDQAAVAYRRVLELDPSLDAAWCGLIDALTALCRWTEVENALAEVELRLARPLPPREFRRFFSLAFTLPYIVENHPAHPAILRRLAESYGTGDRAAPPPRPNGVRLRVGYVASFQSTHPVTRTIAPVLEAHDANTIEVHCFALARETESSGWGRRARSVGHWTDIAGWPTDAIAKEIRRRGIDILIDLTGYMQNARPDLFAARPAPVQVYWIGHGGSLGAPYIDYVIADRTVAPMDEPWGGPERLVRLPHCYHPAEILPTDVAAAGRRADHGLPDDAVVFCAFNNPMKIDPAVFAAWMRILARLPRSVLWLTGDGEGPLAQTLRARAEAAGIAGNRLIFAGHVDSHGAHLARHRHADLFLDTFTYNASTTALDALVAGLPVVARRGASFYSRISQSFLTTLGLSDLIADDATAYVDLAVRLAERADERASLRVRLAEAVRRTPLFDPVSLTRHLERAYEIMLERARAGVAPTDLDVEAVPAR